MGRFIGRSAAQSVGFVFEKEGGAMISKGFLGMRGGSLGAKAMGGLALGMTASQVYGGYKEGGVTGAAKEAAIGVGMWAAGDMAIAALSNPIGIGLAAVGGAGFAAYQFGNRAKMYREDVRRTEMFGSRKMLNVIDNASTERARSLQALNNSALNARMAIGNEAQYLHTSYRGLSTIRR
jgi:hypothetical protein